MSRIRRHLAVAIVSALALIAVAQTRPATKPKLPAKTAPKPTTKSSSRPRSKSAKAKKPARPVGQQRPTSERYKEIEQALAARGYLLEEPSGKWSPAAVQALRNFQADNELPPTGRLDALSLVQLGLGPKRQ